MGEDNVGLSEMSIWRCVLSGPNTRVATFGRVRMAARTIVQMAALQTEVEAELVKVSMYVIERSTTGSLSRIKQMTVCM